MRILGGRKRLRKCDSKSHTDRELRRNALARAFGLFDTLAPPSTAHSGSTTRANLNRTQSEQGQVELLSSSRARSALCNAASVYLRYRPSDGDRASNVNSSFPFSQWEERHACVAFVSMRIGSPPRSRPPSFSG